jgi:hypothetical protein
MLLAEGEKRKNEVGICDEGRLGAMGVWTAVRIGAK